LPSYIQRYISHVMLYNVSLSATAVNNVYNYKVVSASGLALFLDATFWNGTHYIDLSGKNNHGTPYGGLSRVLAQQRWLWVVKGLYGDGKVQPPRSLAGRIGH